MCSVYFVCTHANACTCVWPPMADMLSSLVTPNLILLRKVSRWVRSSLFSKWCLGPGDPPVSTLPSSRVTDVWHHTQLLCGCWGSGRRLSCLLAEAFPQPGSCFLCRLESCVLVSDLCLWRSTAVYHSVCTGRDREIDVRVCIGLRCSYEAACFRMLVLEDCSIKPEADWEMILSIWTWLWLLHISCFLFSFLLKYLYLLHIPCCLKIGASLAQVFK